MGKSGIGNILSARVLSVALGLLAVSSASADEALVDEFVSFDDPIEEIVVTGSRIRHTEFTSPVPVQVIDMELAALAGLHDLTAVLQESTLAVNAPQFNNSVGYNWLYLGEGVESFGGDGANTINLRGLGTGRTLVLLNGRRLNPAGIRGTVTAVDLNTIPSSMIQRIEILKDGASSIYGSDAVSGVVNIVTKKQLEGVESNVWFNMPAGDGGEATSANISFGLDRGDASFLFGLDYFEKHPLRPSDRPWMQCATQHVRDPQTGEDVSSVDPATGDIKCLDSITYDLVVNYGNYPETGDSTRSIWDSSTSSWREERWYESPRDHPSADARTIVSPVTRISAHSFGNWRIDALGQETEGYYELLFNRRHSYQNRGPMQWGQWIPDNPRSPFYNSEGWAEDIALMMPAYDEGWQDVDWWRGVVGATGEVWRNWSWDVNVGYGLSEGTYRYVGYLDDRSWNVLNVVEVAPGVYDCAVNLGPASPGDCVPINPYAIIRDGLDSPELFPRELVDYFVTTAVGTTTYEQEFFSAYLNGDLIEVPAGSIKAVLGVEARRESIDDVPDPEQQADNLMGWGRAGRTRGTDTVREAFAEFEVPLLRDRGAAQLMTLNAAARYSDYDTAGSDTTYRAGLNWQIVDQLRMRASYGTSFRAPALYESFLDGSTSQQWFWGDPCIGYQDEPDLDPNIEANCRAEVGDAAFWPSRTTLVYTVGNDGGLKAETSDSFTVGLVFDFDTLNLAFALDYFEFTIEDEIARFGPGGVAYLCYRLPPDEFRQPGTVCDFLSERSDDFVIGEVRDTFFNLHSRFQRGLDLTLQSTFDVSALQFTADLRASKIFELTHEPFEGQPQDLNGTIGYADLNGQLDLRVQYRDWTFYYGLDYIAGQSHYDAWEVDPETDIYVLSTDDVTYHDLSVGYDRDRWSIQLGVQNITDKRPPEVSIWLSSHAGNSAMNPHYDVLGRRYFLNLSARFQGR